jgi:hypothetical protein
VFGETGPRSAARAIFYLVKRADVFAIDAGSFGLFVLHANNIDPLHRELE